ncbi:MAG: YgjV family protein [Alphaproteobacteria bacterium]|nr:YgjV family protein [Alphaproteobacteria bacterium]
MLQGEALNFFTVQAIGFIGFAIFTASFQLLKPRHTILTQSFANLLIGVHFLGLGHPMPTFIAFAATFRDLGAALIPQDQWLRILLWAYLAAIYSAAFFLAHSWIDVCAIIGSTIATIAQFFRSHFYVYRLCLLGHNVLWIAVNAAMLSIPGLIFMSGIMLSNLIGIARFIKAQKHS